MLASESCKISKQSLFFARTGGRATLVRHRRPVSTGTERRNGTMRIIQGMAVVAVFAGAVALQAQAPAASESTPTADEIVAKHIEAIGGKAAIGQVKSLTIESATSVMGNEAPTVTTVVDGVGYKNETDFNGMKIVQCYNDKSGW